MMRELRVIHFVSDLIDKGELSAEKYRRMFIHTVDAEQVVGNLGVTSKLNADWNFLMYMFETGREKAEEFLEQHFHRSGCPNPRLIFTPSSSPDRAVVPVFRSRSRGRAVHTLEGDLGPDC